MGGVCAEGDFKGCAGGGGLICIEYGQEGICVCRKASHYGGVKGGINVFSCCVLTAWG